MTADNQPGFVVTLVHGTFAKNAAWTRPDSALCSALRARFDDGVLVDTTRWSGRNTFGARRDGAASLREAVMKTRPDLQHFIIAHSHAGNIATYAAMDAAVNRKIAGIVTLATPFIVARRRNLGRIGKRATFALVAICGVAALNLAWLAWPVDWADMWMSLASLILVPFAVFFAIQRPAQRMLRRWFFSSERMLAELQHGGVEKERLLIVRAVADEATGVITFAQFPSLAITLILGGLARFADGCVNWYTRLMQRRLRGALLWAGTFLLVGLLATAVGVIARSGLVFKIVFWSLMVVTWGPMFALLCREPRLARILVATPIALLAVPAVAIMAVTSLALGPRFALANLYLDVSVEATPVGRHEVVLMNPPAAGDPDRAGGMLHSALYDDEETIRLICDFIAARLDAMAALPPENVG